ncbi:hypothetical protein DIPPA_35600 [Diplonema papillatum]|nr:hypothetical protein DIPPA_35600 [Diplonema papillatum]|eukprot:gene2709-4211_t
MTVGAMAYSTTHPDSFDDGATRPDACMTVASEDPASPNLSDASRRPILRSPLTKGPRVIHTEDELSNNGDGRHIFFDVPTKEHLPYGVNADTGDTSSSSSSSSSSGDDDAPTPAPAVKPVHERPDFKWLILFGCFLSLSAGFVNTVAILHGGLTVTHVSGSTANMAQNLVRGEYTLAGNPAIIVTGFLLGAITSGMGVGSGKFVLGHRYGVFILTIGCLMLLGTLLLETDDVNGMVTYGIWAYAAGMQNAMCTSFSGAVIRTTHVTGMLTDIGMCVGHWIRYRLLITDKKHVDTWKMRVLVPQYLSFVMGAMLSARAVEGIGFRAAYFPSGALIVVGLVYIVMASTGVFDGFLEEERVEDELASIEQKFSVALHTAISQHTGGSQHNMASHIGSLAKTASQRISSRQLSHQLDHMGPIGFANTTSRNSMRPDAVPPKPSKNAEELA